MEIKIKASSKCKRQQINTILIVFILFLYENKQRFITAFVVYKWYILINYFNISDAGNVCGFMWGDSMKIQRC